MRRAYACLLWLGFALFPSAALAQQKGTVVVLIPGSGGPVPNDFAMRNQRRIGAAGFETKVAVTAGEAAVAASAAKSQGRKAVFVGMSRGANVAASALASGAPAAGVVFVSGNLKEVAARLGSPAKLPAALIVHHRNDACASTPPSGVDFLQKWSGGKARVSWISNTGAAAPNPCGPRGAHGFFMNDGAAVSAIIGFIRSR